MKGIILASHGKMAKGILDSTKMFFGDQQQIIALSINNGDDADYFYKMMEQSLNKVDSGKGVIIFCDIPFGTPFNTAARLLNEFSNRIDVISGMNLPMILQVLATRETDNLDLDDICKQGVEGIKNIKQILNINT